MTVFEGGALATRCPAMSGARPVVRHSCWAATSGELYDTIEGNTLVYPGLWSVGLAKVEVCLLASLHCYYSTEGGNTELCIMMILDHGNVLNGRLLKIK